MAVRDPRGDQALAILRVVIGIVFMAHGYQKFFMMGIPGVTSFFTQVGAPLPGLAAPFVSTLELAGGAALVAGFLARPIAFLLMCDMLTSILVVHLGNGFFVPDGIEFVVNSGWRSPEYQDQLFQEAIAEYGSPEEAARWVATAATSPHVSGAAVDIGQEDATAWLSEHGAEYGLCQIYSNEPWHYELRPEAIEHGCPAAYADPTEDPRMQQ